QEHDAKVYREPTPETVKLNVTRRFQLPGKGRRKIPTDRDQLSDDLSMSRGTHQFGFGGRLAEARTNVAVQTPAPPTCNFSGTFTGLGLADFLLGRPSDFTHAQRTYIYTRAKYLALYAQDTCRIKPR